MRLERMLLVAGLALVASGCGTRFASNSRVTPRSGGSGASGSATARAGGIASGAAVGTAGANVAAPAAPAAASPAPGSIVRPNPDGSCPASHPIKIGRDAQAHPPGSSGYEQLQPTSCYTTLADAAANGYYTPVPGH